MMSERDALAKLGGLVDKDTRQRMLRERPELDALLVVLAAQDRLDEDGAELDDGEAEAIKVMLIRVSFDVESIERDVIRHLKYESETARTWDQVAEEFGDAYSGRAAVFNRWKRLTNGDRRTTTRDMRRGAAIRRDPDAVGT